MKCDKVDTTVCSAVGKRLKTDAQFLPPFLADTGPFQRASMN